MANLLPTPVAAVLGLVPTFFEGVRRLPGRAVQLPVLAVSSALATMDAARREYEDLADRGERLVARLRGTAEQVAADPLGAADAVEDRIEDIAARTPFAKAYDRGEDALEDVVARVKQAGDAADRAATKGTQAAGQALGAGVSRAAQAADSAADTVDRAAEQVAASTGEAAEQVAGAADQAAGAVGEVADQAAAAADQAAGAADQAADAAPAPEQPKGVPTPKASEPDSTRVDTAASPSVQQVVEQASAGSSASVGHDDLPLPDYDHMTLGSLRGRLRALSVDQLVTIRTYEKSHADRLPVVTMLDNRIAKLATDSAATPSGPVSTSPAPEQLASAGAGGSGSGVSPATTDAPPVNPPSAGDPTNPAQPR